MIFTVDTKDLANALKYVGRVIPAKSPFPIMTTVKIVTNDSKITLIGSDTDTTLETDVPATVGTEGVACIPYATLAKFIGSAKAEICKVSVADAKAKISAGRNRITLSTQDERDYPNFTPPDFDPVTVDKEVFCQALRFATAAVDGDDIRYHISGVNFSESADGVSLWGTDGKSAHFAKIIGLGEIGGGGTLPLEACGAAMAIAENSSDLAFMISGRGWHIASDAARAWGKVVDGNYPNMEGVVAQFSNWEAIASLPKDDLTEAINVASCGADADSAKSRNLILRSEQGGPIVFRGQKAIGGVIHAGRSEIDYQSERSFLGGLSAKYISAALSGLSSPHVSIDGCMDGDSGKALRLSPAQESATITMAATVMALRVSAEEMADV